MQTETIERDYERAAKSEINNVTHQRCMVAYEFARDYIQGKTVLDIGCGNGYGTAILAKEAREVTGVDYNKATVEANIVRYQDLLNVRFVQAKVPPLPFETDSVEAITSFQFIEHLHQRREFLKEAFRVLKPKGVLLLTTPNVKRTLARNPFHVHEYTFAEMEAEIAAVFHRYELFGLSGNDRVEAYYEKNAEWVRKVMRWDVLGLHKILPATLLTKPYNLITHLMR
ncbi:MAG: methyltransferase domain-containing protein [Chloroherpetonaceae bacterium]|nr:methyltransferase domain-containing protein [Chloroherpetonaceae bacterium]